MNPVDLIREKLESCFIFCSYAAPEIRHELGVRHLGQVWTKLPSWYIWLDELPGAFMLELRGGAAFDLDGTACHGAAGVVRYFPSNAQDGLWNRAEVALLQEGTFDNTGTPYLDQLEKIAGTELFVVGTFELHDLGTGDGLLFVYEATKEDVSSAAAGVRLFDSLVGMQAYTSQATPAGPFVWGRQGRAAVFSSLGNGEALLKNYLDAEQLSAVSACDISVRTWSALAERKPVAAEGTGCCCCCH